MWSSQGHDKKITADDVNKDSGHKFAFDSKFESVF